MKKSFLLAGIIFALFPLVGEAASQSYTAPGAYSFTVPSGVDSLSVTIVGAGGGGGGAIMDGDFWSAGGGGSGGYLSQTISVSPGQVLNIAVGGGGCGGHYWYFGYDYGGGCSPTRWSGGNGGDSAVGGYVATGGHGGTVAGGASTFYGLDYNNGAGGSPNGVSGIGGQGGPYNCGYGTGGSNGSGYGSGNRGQGCDNAGSSVNGQDGFVSVSWTPATPCTASNACGATSSGIIVNGVCNATPPANPSGYGSACTSAPNACGQTQTNGTIQCNGSCSSTPPSDAVCPADLTAAAPTISPSSGISVGQSVSLSSLISNIGSGPANGSFPNLFRINTSSLISGSSLGGLAAGASANTTASFTPTSAGAYTVSACADNNTSWQRSITESNEGNNCSADTTFSAAPCTASMSPASVTVEQGESATLSWSPSSPYCGITSCIFADGASYTGASGSHTVSPSTTSTYGLSCIGPYNPTPGTPTVYTTVTVLVPTAALTVNGQSLTARVNPATANNTTVAWSSANSASCTITKNGVAWKTGLSSAGTPDTVTVQTTYAIDCVNNHGVHAVSAVPNGNAVRVNIVPNYQEF